MNPTPLTTLDAEHGGALDTIPITSNATSHGDR
jgi:hypothetical protein